ncbi:MAG: OmpA family protein [Pseudomonadota bacterium]|nr:OmpA family protein [Pseudomonadota bacterium]
MFYWQPGKWVQYAGLLVLPFAGASLLTTDSLHNEISQNALKAAGGDWAKVALDGRDATILGTAPDDAAKAAAIAGVTATYGIRIVNGDGIMVAPPAAPPAVEPPKAVEATPAPVVEAPKAVEASPPAVEAPKVAEAAPPAVEPPKIEPLAAPTVTAATADANGVQITGKWPEGKAKTLDVIINDANSSLDYSLGKSPELTSSDGNWVLKLGASALAAGSYAISAKVGDGESQSVAAVADSLPKLVVPAVEAPKPEPLDAPGVTATKTDDKGTTITGTWPEGKATSLDVVVDNKDYKLGDAKELTSDKGVWTLAIPALAAGDHSIVAMESDGKQTVGMTAPAQLAIAVPTPPPAPPPPPTPPPAAATAENVAATVDRPTITGTWPVGNGNTYQVELDGVTHTLGKDPDLLTTADGKWTLTPAKPLVNGTYDVIMKVTGADGQTTSSISKGAVVINVAPPAPAPPPPPAAATAENVAATVDRPTITGTWPVGNGNTYQLELDGVTHTLGKDPDLLTTADGKWTLTPAKPLVNGTYDVIMKVTGADGQTTSSISKGAVVINVAPPAPAPPPEKPYDCGAALATTAAAYPVRFAFDHADLAEDYPMNVSHYADVLNDPRCKAIHMQVTGHADNIGTDAYNQSLSERRASTVAALLGKDGVDASRISTLGVGSTKPLDPANTKDARAKNRRAEFNAQ